MSVPRKLRWQADAACFDMVDVFFPTPSNKPEVIAHYLSIARPICAACPVSRECREYADKNQERHGIWDGDWREGVAHGYNEHGTEERYRQELAENRHLPAGERTCPDCRTAHARYVAEGKARRAAEAAAEAASLDGVA